MNSFSVLTLFYLKIVFISGQAKIKGGQDAEPGDIPYQALLMDEHGLLCGGAIINEYWILTAAHCLPYSDPNDIVVYVGALYSNGEDGVAHQVKKIIPHEKYYLGRFGIRNDIGLIQLTDGIQFNDTVRPISLPRLDINEMGSGLPATMSGYGVTIPSAVDPSAIRPLRYAIVEIENQAWCHAQWGSVTRRHICTKISNGKSACIGDSGGPVVISNAVIGIISYGDGMCGWRMPNVNTRVYSYLSWIRNKMTKG